MRQTEQPPIPPRTHEGLSLRVMGVDTGMGNLGFVVVDVPSGALSPTAGWILEMDLFQTVPTKGLIAADDTFERARAQATVLSNVMRRYGVQLVTFEGLSHVPSSAAMTKIGHCFGVLAGLVAAFAVPSLHASPKQIKLGVTGREKAEKQEVAEALDAMFFQEPRGMLADVNPGDREHPYDALGTIVTLWNDPLFVAARQGIV